jgi:cation transport ATPase
MSKITFKTNINCASCKATVEKTFKGRRMYKTFDVDFNDPDKLATFDLEENINPEEIQKLIREAGYKAEIVKRSSWLDKLKK